MINGCASDDENSSSAPKILSFSPEYGLPSSTVKISGSNFSADKSDIEVKFNGVQATIVNASISSINVEVPAAKSGRITITVSGETASSESDFKVLIDMNQVLDDFIEDNPSVPAISMAMIKDGIVSYRHSAGFYDIDKTKIPDENTLYLMASISKLMVATSIMQQVELGKLDLDKDIGDYLGFEVRNPNFPNNVISTRMLMKHTSSLANPSSGEAVEDIFLGYEPEDVISLHPLIEEIITPNSAIYKSGIWMNVAPGSLHKNSNFGMTLLGYLVEKLSGDHFNDYTSEKIFKPLGMTGSNYYYPDLDEKNISATYPRNSDTAFTPFSFWLYPAEMLYTSTEDWLKFLSAILNGGTLNGNRILDESSVSAMLDVMTPSNNQIAYNSNIGLIWREAPANLGWIGHTGAGLGTSITEISLKHKIGYAVFTNKGGIDSIIGPGGTLNTIVHQWIQEQIDYN